MKITAENMQMYLVTDRSWLKPGETLAEQVETALAAGATCVQLREKHTPREEFLALARELKPVCARYGVPFLINDDLEIAREVDADGVHVGQEDAACREARRVLGPDKIIGVSCHTLQEALQAVEDGADYLGLGAVFATGTKGDATAMDHEELRRICAGVSLPKVAIGGISEKNILDLAGTGVDGVAVISAVFACEDKAGAVRRLRELAGRLKA